MDSRAGRKPLLTSESLHHFFAIYEQTSSIKKACHAIGVSERALYEWVDTGRRLVNNIDLRRGEPRNADLCVALFERLEGLKNQFSDPALFDSRNLHARAALESPTYSEIEFTNAVIARIGVIAQTLALPPLISVQQERILSNRRRVDLFITHPANEYTIVEIKVIQNYAKFRSVMQFSYTAIGQLVYYLQVAKSEYPSGSFNLCLLTDFTPDTFCLDAYQCTTPRIRFLNATELLV